MGRRKSSIPYPRAKQKSRPVNLNQTIDVSNGRLNLLLTDYKAQSSPENLTALVNHLTGCRLLVPAKLNEQKQPMPCLLKNQDGTLLFPVFSDKTQIPSNMRGEVILNMPFSSVNGAVLQNESLSGIIVNPFTNQLVLKTALVEKINEAKEQGIPLLIEQERSQQPVSDEQILREERHRFEASFLPRKLFSEGMAFMDRLMEQQEEYIDALYEESFRDKRRYPYLPEDFSVMTMNLSETLSVIRIDMPREDMAPGLAARVYCICDDEQKRQAYFLICAGNEPGSALVCEVTRDLKGKTHGPAPVEGAELSTILSLAQVP